MKNNHQVLFFIIEIFVIIKQSLLIKKWTACVETIFVRPSFLVLAYKPFFRFS